MAKTTLNLRLEKWLEGRQVRNGAIANVYPVGTTFSSEQNKLLRNIVIPAGTNSAFRSVDVDPGRYLIEAQLPSGETLTQEIEVPQATPSLDVSFRGDSSPHEWLSWQHFAGNVQSRTEETLAPTSGFESFGAATRSIVPPIDVQQLTLAPMAPTDDRSWQWVRLAEASRQAVAAPVWPGLVAPLPPGPSDEMVQSFVVDPPPGTPQFFDGAADVPGGRRLLWVGEGSRRELVSLPTPWLDVGRQQWSGIDIAVRKELKDPRGFRTSITVRDESFGSAVGFMTVGGLANAATVFGQAKEMLMDKVMNPFAAAAGAYVLVSTQQGNEGQAWYSWVRNLMQWFPWLPDGAIQYGRLKQLDEESDQDLDEARAALFQAYRRGLPFFSAGVRWLLNGLTVLASDGDEEAEAMAKVVHRVSLRTDMSQPFTNVRCGPRS